MGSIYNVVDGGRLSNVMSNLIHKSAGYRTLLIIINTMSLLFDCKRMSGSVPFFILHTGMFLCLISLHCSCQNFLLYIQWTFLLVDFTGTWCDLSFGTDFCLFFALVSNHHPSSLRQYVSIFKLYTCMYFFVQREMDTHLIADHQSSYCIFPGRSTCLTNYLSRNNAIYKHLNIVFFQGEALVWQVI